MLGLSKSDLALLAQKPENARIHVLPMGTQLQQHGVGPKTIHCNAMMKVSVAYIF